MATISITTENDLESNYSPAPGDQYFLSGVSSLIFDRSTVALDRATAQSIFTKLIFRNTSTTQINICEIDYFYCNSGTIELDGQLIDAGTLTGTASETLTIPSDASGNFPPELGYGYIEGSLYTQASSFADMYADKRGRHFLYDSVTGLVTFGDGTNGDMPTGVFKIPNIFIINNILYLFKGIITGVGRCAFIDMQVGFGFSCRVTEDWGIINHSGGMIVDADKKHQYGKLNFISMGTNAASMVLGEDTIGDEITYQTERVSYNEITCAIVPFWGSHTFRMIAQNTLTYVERIKLGNDGGDASLTIYQGGSPSFNPKSGNGGKFDITVSDGYLRTDSPPNNFMQNTSSDCDIELLYRLYGDFNYASSRDTLFRGSVGTYKIGSSDEKMIFPSTMKLGRIFYFDKIANGSINNLSYEGTSNSTDYNISTPKGFLISNVDVPNDTVNNATANNAEYELVSMIGLSPNLGNGMSSSIIVKDAGRTQAQVWMHVNTLTPNGSIISGSDTDIIHDGRSVYFTDIGNKTRSRSRMLNGVDNVAAAVITGSNVGDFAVTYKVWEAGSEEPATYKAFTTANVQADTAFVTTGAYWFIECEFEKIAGAVNSAYLRGIYLDMDLEPGYVWEDIQDMVITFTGLEVGDYYYVSDSAGNTKAYGQATASTEVVSILGIDDGQEYSFATDFPGKVADIGTFTVVAGGSLTIPVVMPELTRTDGQPMYTNTTDAAISVSYDFIVPEGIIDIGNKVVEGQTVFDMVEDSLVTEQGMRWHTVYGTIVKFNKVAASGDIIDMEGYWRLRRASTGDINAGVSCYVGSEDGVVVDGVNGDVKFSPAGVSSAIAAIPTNPLLDDDPRLNNLDTPVSSVSISEQDKDDIATKVWDEEL